MTSALNNSVQEKTTENFERFYSYFVSIHDLSEAYSFSAMKQTSKLNRSSRRDITM